MHFPAVIETQKSETVKIQNKYLGSYITTG